jgi:hypothetical protein
VNCEAYRAPASPSSVLGLSYGAGLLSRSIAQVANVTSVSELTLEL